MIRIDRGVEPSSLAVQRLKKRARAVLVRRKGGVVAFDGYEVARKYLYDAQNAKCVYCERQQGLAGQPVEHFRPKDGADRGDPFGSTHHIDPDYYWWLAWTWTNLFFACVTCNSKSFKANWFPLGPGTPPIAQPGNVRFGDHSPCYAVAVEQRLLVDPGWDDPMDHITWRPLDQSAPVDQQEWRPLHRTEQGRITIQILGLDKHVVDHVGEHIRRIVHPWVERVLATNPQDVLTTWMEVLKNLFAPKMPFHAATYDALDFFLPVQRRNALGIVLERPGAPILGQPQTTGSPAAASEPKLWGVLPDDVVLEIHAGNKTIPELIALICEVIPATVDDLSEALRLTRPTVRGHCSRLQNAGTIVRNADGRYKVAPP